MDAVLPRPAGQSSGPAGPSDAVFRHLLAKVFDGSLDPGASVSEHRVAAETGVSRTPVREAIQRLKALGLVESSAGRTTRVVTVTEADLRAALVAWSALYDAVIAEVGTTLTTADLTAMRGHADAYAVACARLDSTAAADANFELFAVPVTRSRNPALVEAVAATVYIVRLGGQWLPRWIDTAQLAAAQHDFLVALEGRDTDAAAAAARAATRFRLSPA